MITSLILQEARAALLDGERALGMWKVTYFPLAWSFGLTGGNSNRRSALRHRPLVFNHFALRGEGGRPRGSPWRPRRGCRSCALRETLSPQGIEFLRTSE